MIYTAKISPDAIDPKRWIEKYRDSLFRYAIVRLRDADLAEETIQETFLAALKSRKGFQGLASEKTWLISILRRKIYDHFRRKSRDKKLKTTYRIDHPKHDASACYKTIVARSLEWFSDPSVVYEQKEFLRIFKDGL